MGRVADYCKGGKEHGKVILAFAYLGIQSNFTIHVIVLIWGTYNFNNGEHAITQ